MSPANDRYARFRDLSDDQWHGVLLRSIDQRTVDDVQLPAFPHPSTQELFTSRKHRNALEEAFRYFRVVKSAAAAHGRPLGKDTQLLDFGVGWGRIARYFLRDVPAQNILGVDVNPEILAECKALLPDIRYLVCAQDQKLDVKDGSIDVVTAFSVFSHLSPPAAGHWIRELHRVMRKGATAVLTTLAPGFSGVARGAALNTGQSDWHTQIGGLVKTAYPDWETKLSAWPEDEFLFLPTGGGFTYTAPAHYGLAMVPAGWVRKNWSEMFDLTDYLVEPYMLDQAVMVLRRR